MTIPAVGHRQDTVPRSLAAVARHSAPGVPAQVRHNEAVQLSDMVARAGMTVQGTGRSAPRTCTAVEEAVDGIHRFGSWRLRYMLAAPKSCACSKVVAMSDRSR